MKKVYLITALVLEILACAGAKVMQHFTSRKMGMLRWVNDISNKLSKKADVDSIYLAAAIIVAVLVLVLAFWAIGKLANRSGAFEGLMCLMMGSAGYYIAYTIAYTRKLRSAYYLVSPILLIGTAAAIICFALAVRKEK